MKAVIMSRSSIGPIEEADPYTAIAGVHISRGEGVAACAAWPSANTASVVSIGAASAICSYLLRSCIAEAGPL
jgi:hypothetical protein